MEEARNGTFSLSRGTPPDIAEGPRLTPRALLARDDEDTCRFAELSKAACCCCCWWRYRFWTEGDACPPPPAVCKGNRVPGATNACGEDAEDGAIDAFGTTSGGSVDMVIKPDRMLSRRSANGTSQADGDNAGGGWRRLPPDVGRTMCTMSKGCNGDTRGGGTAALPPPAAARAAVVVVGGSGIMPAARSCCTAAAPAAAI